MTWPVRVHEIIERNAARPGGLLPALHEVQEALGHLPSALVGDIAIAFNISVAEVHGVISFYPDFRSHPTGDHVLRICRAEACQSLGADALAAHAARVLGCDVGATTADGRITLEPVYCLGLCGQAPAVMLDDQLHARVNPARLDRLLQAAGAVEPATDGGNP